MDKEKGTFLRITGLSSDKRDHPGDSGTGSDSETGSGLSDKKGGFREAYEKFRREHDLVDLNIDPDEVFADVRDPSPGRDFEW